MTMEVSCAGQSRRIRIDILNRDMFDPQAGTPEHTSWTMALLGRLDRALGSSRLHALRGIPAAVAKTTIQPDAGRSGEGDIRRSF